MRLDQDCVRDLLLELESKLSFNQPIFIDDFKELETVSSYGYEISVYALLKMIEAKFVNANVTYAGDEIYQLAISSLTWDGHQFLDTIRDHEVWKETKAATKKLSSVSLSIISTLATEFLKKKLGL